MSAAQDLRPSQDADGALRVFRAAVERHSRDGSGIEYLRIPLQLFCAHARRERMTAEQVVISVKHALDGVPRSDKDFSDGKESFRSRLVTFAITTYYSDD